MSRCQQSSKNSRTTSWGASQQGHSWKESGDPGVWVEGEGDLRACPPASGLSALARTTSWAFSFFYKFTHMIL